MKTETMVLTGLMMLAGAGTLAGCVSTTGQAATGATPGQTVADEAGQSEDGDKIRCKRMAITGSRNGKKVCHTEAQWAAMERAADTMMNDIQSGMTPFEDGKTKSIGVP